MSHDSHPGEGQSIVDKGGPTSSNSYSPVGGKDCYICAMATPQSTTDACLKLFACNSVKEDVGKKKDYSELQDFSKHCYPQIGLFDSDADEIFMRC